MPMLEPDDPAAPPIDPTVQAATDRIFRRPVPAGERRAPPPRRPGAFTAIDWDGLRRKAWHGALLLGSAYISAKPEKYGWLMPVLTAVAGTSAPPTGKPSTAMASVLAVMVVVLGWRAWA